MRRSFLRSATTVLAALALSAGGVIVGAPAAVAATNDEITSALAVTALPYSDSQSLETATRAPDDPDVGYGPTVWYVYQPASDTNVAVSLKGSSVTDGVIGAFTGQPGALTLIGWSDRMALPVTANTTYYFMVSTWWSLEGYVDFNMEEIPPPLTAAATLLRSTVSKTGVVTVSGTVTCNQGAYGWVYIDASQANRRFSSFGSGDAPVAACSTSPTTWSATLVSATYTPFIPGKITVHYYIPVANDWYYDAKAEGTQTVIATGTR